MASLRDIRNRIQSVQNTQQVTRAMKMVAAAKLRRAQERMFASRPYAYKMRDVIQHLRQWVDPAQHPLFADRTEVKGVLMIIATSDRGLAGAFNTNVIKSAEQAIAEQYADVHAAGKLKLICVGRKGHEYFQKRGYTLLGEYRGIMDNLKVSVAHGIMKTAMEGFLAGEWDHVVGVYNEFKNTISQNRIVEPILPIPAERFLTPVMEIDAAQVPEVEHKGEMEFIFEPNADSILEALVPQYLTQQMWRILIESSASEQGARMVAMDNATNNATELLKELKLNYNRARQAAITTEIIEIVSGANALEG